MLPGCRNELITRTQPGLFSLLKFGIHGAEHIRHTWNQHECYLCWLSPHFSMLVLCSSVPNMPCQTCARRRLFGDGRFRCTVRERTWIEIQIINKCDLGVIWFPDSSCLSVHKPSSLSAAATARRLSVCKLNDSRGLHTQRCSCILSYGEHSPVILVILYDGLFTSLSPSNNTQLHPAGSCR